MKNLFKTYIAAIMLFTNFNLFAQPDDTDGTPGGLEGDEPIVAPINGKLFLLALVGVLFVLYTFRNNKKTA